MSGYCLNRPRNNDTILLEKRVSASHKCSLNRENCTSIDNNIIMTMTDFILGMFFFSTFNRKTLWKKRDFFAYFPLSKQMSSCVCEWSSCILLRCFSTHNFGIFISIASRQDFKTGRSSFWWFVFLFWIIRLVFTAHSGAFCECVDASFYSPISRFEQGNLKFVDEQRDRKWKCEW